MTSGFRRAVGLTHIYSKPTIGFIIFSIICFLIAILFTMQYLASSGSAKSLEGALLIVFCSLLGYHALRLCLHYIFASWLLREYRHIIDQSKPLRPKSVLPAHATVNEYLHEDNRLVVIDEATGRRTFLIKNESYLSLRFTILQVNLRRAMPHIIFDSPATKAGRFGVVYSKAQVLPIRPSFDRWFKTYVPATYHIDTLSFLTPEVLEALITARDFDIEIVDDKLLLYGPLMSRNEVQRLAEIGSEIGRQLDDNIDLYRDDRLSGQQRRESVSPLGRKLIANPWLIIWPTVASGLIAGYAVYYGTRHGFTEDSAWLTAAVIMIFGQGFYIISEQYRQSNRRLDRLQGKHRDTPKKRAPEAKPDNW